MEALAKEEGRTKSELFREMVRVYRTYRQQRKRDEETWMADFIKKGNGV
jgi:metal-responsive CopG/Arc/MetJ family transcriptional regulator